MTRAFIALLLICATAAADAPALKSPTAIAIDASTGAELFAKDADEIRPIASMTKIFVALVLRRRQLDLEGWSTITDEDVALSDGGAASALRRGQAFRRLDLLHAMLLVSDNRVPSALARSVGLDTSELLAAMHELAAELGLAHTKFADATGILGNQSTPREMAIAMREALRDPVLARILRTRSARVASKSEAVSIEYRSTILPLWWDRDRVRGGKTGHTEDAGYCLMIGADVGGRDVVMAFLGAPAHHARFADYTALSRWLARR